MSRRRFVTAAAFVLSAVVACGPSHAGAATSGDPFVGHRLYVDPHSAAAQAADQLRASRPHDASELDKIAKRPQADWFGDWDPTGSLTTTVADRVRTIRAAGAMPLFVVYDIPLRDCHGYSGGGAASPAAYKTWINHFVTGVGAGAAAVVVEPDALAQLDCLSPADRATRLSLLRYAVQRLSAHPRTAVYLDAGHSGWIDAATMAQRLRSADVADARGFSLNVSNYDYTRLERAYGDRIVGLLGGKHFVIDTSRNGVGSDGTWCNASGRALGARPTTRTGDGRVDAYLWIKRPGESDGTCNGGPASGQWWTDYAIGLAERAAY